MLRRLTPVAMGQQTKITSTNSRAPEALRATLVSLEETIRNEPTERGYLLDPTGQVLTARQGNINRIEWTDADAMLFKGNILTHNHPSGASFSYADLTTALVDRLSEIRVVTKEHTYSWRFLMYPDREEFDRAFKMIDDEIFVTLKGKIDIGEMTLEHAEKTHGHLRNQLLQKTFSQYVRYERTTSRAIANVVAPCTTFSRDTFGGNRRFCTNIERANSNTMLNVPSSWLPAPTPAPMPAPAPTRGGAVALVVPHQRVSLAANALRLCRRLRPALL